MHGYDSEPIQFTRACAAVVIPAGEPVELPAGTIGYIYQALGGSFTIFAEGNLFRIAGKDADAIGKEPTPPVELPEDASKADVEKLIWDQMRTCFDPEIPINIVDLGLVYSCKIDHRADGTCSVAVEMTLTAPGCGMGEILVHDVREKVGLIPIVEQVDVDLVFDPPWNQSMMSEEAKLQTGMFY